MKTKRTPEQFKQLFNSLHPTLELLSDYVNSSSTIKVKCKICGKEWAPRADTLKKIKCTTCEKSEKYKEQVKQALLYVQILTPIIYKAHDNVECECGICGYKWNTASVSHLKQGHGCPKCAGNAKKSEEEIISEITAKHSNLQVISVKNYYNITVQCRDCGTIRNSSLYRILKYSKCEICSGFKYNNKTFREKLFLINPNIEVLGEYTNSEQNLQVKCKKCGRIWNAKPSKLLEGIRCTCEHDFKGELLVLKILEKFDIKYIRQYKVESNFSLQNKMFIDFYLPDYNLFIEYNGKQHYIPIEYFGGELQFNKQQIRDEELREYCKLNNIKLLELKYNLSSEEIKDKILKTLNIDSN